jgi:hypothetical protein
MGMDFNNPELFETDLNFLKSKSTIVSLDYEHPIERKFKEREHELEKKRRILQKEIEDVGPRSSKDIENKEFITESRLLEKQTVHAMEY